jgi:hypothetical protein
VVYLRMLPETAALVHAELQRVLSLYPQAQLQSAFVVVEDDGHRLRRIPVRDK